MDFFTVGVREIERGPDKGKFEIYPDFIVGRSQDLMVRGKSFYAIWDEEAGLWSTDEYAVQRLIDAELSAYAAKAKANGEEVKVKYMKSFGSNGWSTFRKFVQNISDNYHDLDATLTFANTDVKKTDYVSRRLPYPLAPGDHSAWDELVSTLYEPDERAKIEWIIGAIVSGDSKKIQKFGVFYGPPGSGKGTILDVIERLFMGYTTSFEAKQLGMSGSQFATEVFRANPLVAIQGDGDLSKIEDNARLNSIISHENMTMNEKFKSSYTARIFAFLLMGTNKPVKISDAKSGIIRRLIDIHPSGNKIPPNHYHTLMAQTDFELGAIAQHCLDVYRDMGKNFYNGYRPTEMMLQTDVFFNFIEAHFDIFKKQDGATLLQAYALYKEFCAETGIEFVLPRHKFRDEFRNYFEHFHDRITINGEQFRSFYQGFNAEKFKAPVSDDATIFSLVMEETVSLLDLELADMPAQLARISPEGGEIPSQRWINVKTTLAEIDTSKVHYVKVPENHIVIDFDIQDEMGNKSLEKNLEAASKWPSTYGELSKGGNGVHLHYIWDGDVKELASLYEPGIEIKTLLGDASLRRRLSKCNNVPVATINSGLPFKEKKPVLEERTIQSERGLRELIRRTLQKEFHAGSKPAIDFVKKILDEAYESGMQYNVEDLRPKLIAYANNSTHQPLTALKVVLTMKWKSEEEIRSVDQVGDDDREVIFDVEVYPNLFVVCWKYSGAPKESIVRMINPSPEEMATLMKMRLVGFFNRQYDNHIVYARFLGYDNERLFQLSQKLINGSVGAKFGEAYNISYADIYEVASIKMSLKKWQIELGIHHQELDIPWDQPVPKKLWDNVLDYCCNDVESTDAVRKDREPDFVARKILAELSGLSINDTTQRHTAQIIFGKDRNPQGKFVYTDLSEMFPGYKFDPFAKGKEKSTYRGEDIGEGGLVRAKPGMYEDVVLLDVASMHPTSLIELNAFGPYTKNFADLLNARLAIKHKDYDSARQMLNGRLAPYLGDPAGAKKLSYALKIVINIVYGMTSASFDNSFRDPRNKDNIVAKRGALFMLDLMHFIEERGFTVAHIKTDSVKIPGATPEIIEEVMQFGKKYGYTFEHEATYDKFCLVNDAVYIARYGWHAEDPKKVGTWDAVGAQFQHPYVFKALFSHESIGWDDYCEPRSVMKGLMYLEFEGREKLQFVGRTGLFVPVTKESGGGTLYRVSDDKKYAVAGTKGHYWLEAEEAESRSHEIDIDLEYFEALVDKAVKTMEKYGSLPEFMR